jgi:hypothetical protein
MKMGVNKYNALPGLAILLLGLGVTASGYASSVSEPTTCEIRVASNGGMLAIQGVVNGGIALSGSYQMRVSGQGPGGSTNLNQGGQFNAGAGEAVTLGQVMVDNSGGTYDVVLSIDSAEGKVDCQGHFGSPT